LVSYNRGVGIRFVANDRYWRGPPKLREVDVRFIPDVNTILTMAQKHEIDLCYGASILDQWNVPGASIAQIWGAHQIAGMHLILAPFGAVRDIGLNMTTPALRDVRVRRALAYANRSRCARRQGAPRRPASV
jgi:ABC-type transport system substrate-binding protein